MHFENANCGTKINEALLYAARNFQMQRASISEHSRLSGLILDNFLWSAPMLKALRLDLFQCGSYDEAALGEFRGLQGLSRHTSLERLELIDIWDVATLEQVARILCHLKLLTFLEIRSVEKSTAWASADSFVDAVKGLKILRYLAISGHYLTDQNLTFMLGGLKELRLLLLDSHGGTLSDDASKAIAQKCPNLRFLSISGQKGMTVSGFKALLQHCPLIALRAVLVPSVQPCHYKELAQASSTLLILKCSMPAKIHQGEELDEANTQIVHDAILACNGRVIFCDDEDTRQGRYQAPASSLPSSVLARQHESYRILDKLISVDQQEQWSLESCGSWLD
jgi:hypothetical protein